MSDKKPLPIPVDHRRYPIIWWYCAVEKHEVDKVCSKVLKEFKDPFELRQALRQELHQLIREQGTGNRERGRK